MKYLLLGFGLALASCASQRPPFTSHVPETAHPDEGPAYTPDALTQRADSSSKALSALTSPVDKPGLLRWIFPAKALPLPDINAPQLPRKCKGCTIVYGPATVAGKKATVAAGENAVASHIEKKAGPSIVASDSSTQNAVLGGGNIQATNGNNNTPTLSAPVQQAADWRAELAKPTGKLIAGALVVVLIGGGVYGFILWRKKKAAANLV
jgi:hypothetical protein